MLLCLPVRLRRSRPAGPLHASYWDARNPIHGWRPRGSRDWLLLYTEAGSGHIRYKGGVFNTRSGDVILYQPGTPQDYGVHVHGARWKHVWAHWVPAARRCPGFPGRR